MMKTTVNPEYIPRHLATKLQEALTDTPVVCLLGPRQCGKSTLVRHLEPDRTYINLDDRNYLEVARRDPEGFIDNLPERVAIDEIQRAPELTLAIKRSVDAKRHPGRFLLTGSANLLQLPRLADSLAGRMECLYLHPLTEAEKQHSPGRFLDLWLEKKLDTSLPASGTSRASELPGRLVAGGYPEAFFRQPVRARSWQQQYLHSIIERDIHDIATIRGAIDVQRLLEYLSHQTASLMNIAAIANALGYARPTIERYLGVLEKLFLIRQLPAWHSNRGKRLVKTPKIHICDSGLAATLSNLRAEQWIPQRKRFGHLLESFVVQQIIAMGGWCEKDLRFHYYRDKDQVEVDLIIEADGTVWGIEVKAAATLEARDGRGLMRLADVAGTSFHGGLILYDGDAVLPIEPKRHIFAVPFGKLWEL
ncbi:AAA family ATPase [Desulfurispirillum indicum S5]|uniref:AAA family ATPase n=2 Tax=Desulfurispirillum TaxID=393029 RepID=E6W6E0_DESIS|nr:AAA family ATPase [Desulfurispirillum indicum S5]